MHVIVNITTKQSRDIRMRAYTIIILLFVWYNYVVGPMARPGARGLGPGLGRKYDNCVAGRAGPGHTFCGPGRVRAS